MLSLYFSFKLGVTIQITWKFSHTERKSYACTYSAGFYYSNSVWEQDHKKVKCMIMSQLQLRMVRPLLDQPDQFQHLCSKCNYAVYIQRRYLRLQLQLKATTECIFSRKASTVTVIKLLRLDFFHSWLFTYLHCREYLAFYLILIAYDCNHENNFRPVVWLLKANSSACWTLKNAFCISEIYTTPSSYDNPLAE